MALKASLKDLNEVPEALRALYKQDGEFFVLDLEGVEDHPGTKALKNAFDRVKEENRKNSDKANRLAADVEKYKDIDPERAREALSKLDKMEDDKLISEGKVDELLNQKTERMRADFDAQLRAKETRIAELEGEHSKRLAELSDIKIFTAVKDAAIAKSVRKTALDDIVNRAKPVFKLVDGQVVAIKPGSDEVWYGKKGDQMTIAEWVENLSADAPHLFEPSGGGGTGGGRAPVGDGRTKVINLNEPNAIGNNLEAISRGEARVVR